MKTLYNRIEDKEDLAPLGLIKIEYLQSSEIDILVKHINRHIKNLHFYYPAECPFPGAFEYSIIYKEYNIPENPSIQSFQIESKLYYRYNGNIDYIIVDQIEKTFVYYDTWRESIINIFNYACFTTLVKETLNDILFGNVIISKNPNHFFYNMTYIDITKLKTVRQEKLFNDEKV